MTARLLEHYAAALRLLHRKQQARSVMAEAKSFRKMTHDLHDLTMRLDTLLDHSTRRDVQWFVKAASTLLK